MVGKTVIFRSNQKNKAATFMHKATIIAQYTTKSGTWYIGLLEGHTPNYPNYQPVVHIDPYTIEAVLKLGA